MSDVKSSYEAALERMKTMGIEDEGARLSQQHKEDIARLRRDYEAKIAEKKIMLAGEPELGTEILRLEQERDEKIRAVHTVAGADAERNP